MIVSADEIREGFEINIQDKLNNNEKLDEKELRYLVNEYGITSYPGENHRWVREETTIVEFNNKFYVIYWWSGLTEMQDDEFDSQPIEVTKIEKPITVTLTEWLDKDGEVMASSSFN